MTWTATHAQRTVEVERHVRYAPAVLGESLVRSVVRKILKGEVVLAPGRDPWFDSPSHLSGTALPEPRAMLDEASVSRFVVRIRDRDRRR